MRAVDRLRKIKEEMESSATIDKFVSLTNPKNVILMESLVAWTCTDIEFDGEQEVNPDCGIDELWGLNRVNMREFSDTAGITVSEGIAKMRQMRNLGLIFPDGTALSKAVSIVKVYVKNKLEGL